MTLVDAAAAAICERRNADDEFWEGIWWVPDGTGKVRNATPGECAAEIKRLRGVIMSVQRSSFDAGFDAGQDGDIRAWAYEAWAGQQ